MSNDNEAIISEAVIVIKYSDRIPPILFSHPKFTAVRIGMATVQRANLYRCEISHRKRRIGVNSAHPQEIADSHIHQGARSVKTTNTTSLAGRCHAMWTLHDSVRRINNLTLPVYNYPVSESSSGPFPPPIPHLYPFIRNPIPTQKIGNVSMGGNDHLLSKGWQAHLFLEYAIK
ncbi:hypothetical protein EVAR_76921_1 [Eumeta japonica]|uniref:Uncharacterized protein n=1 Tax=Eumeta variegata TaxID=151549 RepID=A0A4C1SH07_EUMVA|nr:hypothetical protein EVAR_76921_1 [Eumeta japonica]